MSHLGLQDVLQTELQRLDDLEREHSLVENPQNTVDSMTGSTIIGAPDRTMDLFDESLGENSSKDTSEECAEDDTENTSVRNRSDIAGKLPTSPHGRYRRTSGSTSSHATNKKAVESLSVVDRTHCEEEPASGNVKGRSSSVGRNDVHVRHDDMTSVRSNFATGSNSLPAKHYKQTSANCKRTSPDRAPENRSPKVSPLTMDDDGDVIMATLSQHSSCEPAGSPWENLFTLDGLEEDIMQSVTPKVVRKTNIKKVTVPVEIKKMLNNFRMDTTVNKGFAHNKLIPTRQTSHKEQSDRRNNSEKQAVMEKHRRNSGKSKRRLSSDEDTQPKRGHQKVAESKLEQKKQTEKLNSSHSAEETFPSPDSRGNLKIASATPVASSTLSKLSRFTFASSVTNHDSTSDRGQMSSSTHGKGTLKRSKVASTNDDLHRTREENASLFTTGESLDQLDLDFVD